MYGEGCEYREVAPRNGDAGASITTRDHGEYSLFDTVGDGRCLVGGDIIRWA